MASRYTARSTQGIHDQGTMFVFPAEAERLVQELKIFPIEEVGTTEWMRQHQYLEKLNFQVHASAKAHADEFVVESILLFDKINIIIHELLVIETWKAFVYTSVKSELANSNSTLRGYFMLYHEATLVNMLEILLYHETVCDSTSDDMLMELVDYCARKLAWMNSLSKEQKEQISPAAKDLAGIISKNTAIDELDRQKMEIEFQISITVMSLVRYLSEHIKCLPLCVISRMIDKDDLLLSVAPLIENPPWTRRLSNGKWQKIVDNKWQDVLPEELLTLTKTEGQAWLALFYLVCDPECRKRYHFNTYRKGAVLRVRKYLNEVLLDQLPILADLQRFLDELQIVQAPEPTASAAFLLEQIPRLRLSLLRHDWKAVAEGQVSNTFGRMSDSSDAVLKEIAELYQNEHFESFLDDPKCALCGGNAEKRCSRCKTEWYCSRQCQVSAWKAHKSLCDIIFANSNSASNGTSSITRVNATKTDRTSTNTETGTITGNKRIEILNAVAAS